MNPLSKIKNLNLNEERLRNVSIYVIAIIASFGLIAIVIGLLGYDVFKALKTLVWTSFKTSFGLQSTIKKTITLIFTTYAFAIPSKIKHYNIGAQGQMLIGGATVTILGLALAQFNLPSVVMIAILLIAGAAAGAIYFFISSLMYLKFKISPIVSTIMLNFVAVLFVYFVATTAPWADPFEGHPISKALPLSALLPTFGKIPSSIIFAILTVVAVCIIMNKTIYGYQIKAVGYNLNTANLYGINYNETLMLTFLLAGGIAGLGGSLEILNIHGKLIEGFHLTSGAEYGMFGILTSLICSANPIGVPVTAFFMSVLLVGADALQRSMQIPVEMIFLAQALIVLFLVAIREKFASKYQ